MKNQNVDFGSRLFSEDVMGLYLPKPIFQRWKNSVLREEPMDKDSADAIAHAMKTWALEQGVTHYSHWFHPMTGASAEKHVAFLEPSSSDKTISRFSGTNLIKGETDGSSFPNGGLRQTFEARGYSYWDVTSPAFIRGHVLFIPSIFISYHGDSLDEKAPLIKSMEALSLEATRVVNALGEKSVKSCRAMVGLEQEYFLISTHHYAARDDIRFTGRTLVGKSAPKEQEASGHYFGAIPSEVVHFMDDVNTELWRLGIYSKVQHNEVAPSQFENAVVYRDVNVAIDQNMLVMETLKRVALKHDMVALLHEKPFANVNGSGKHNNFSLVTDTGSNLFDPGERPHENVRFLIFACALLRAVDTHAELLRFAASTPGNDHRLGASEAPPAIISIFMGEVLEDILHNLETVQETHFDKEVQLYSPLSSLSASPKDYSDRNRTSPFAFTGNKFEFRMPGSSICSAFTNTVLCVSIAESLQDIADELEEFKYVQEAREHALKLCQDIVKKHKRIMFSGDGYHASWIEEANKRNLPNIAHYIDSIPSLLKQETVDVFAKHKVLNYRELASRSEISHEQFIESIKTEAIVMVSMIKTTFLPSITEEYQKYGFDESLEYLKRIKKFLGTTIDGMSDTCTQLELELKNLDAISELVDRSKFAQETIKPILCTLRTYCDDVESELSSNAYPLPTYSEMLFN